MLNKSKIKIYASRLLIGFLCVFPVYQWFFVPFTSALNHMARGRDAEEANKFYTFITKQINFEQKSLLDSNRPSISVDPRNHGLRFDVYGLTNYDDKKRLLAAAYDWQSTNSHVEDFQIRFFSQEQPRGYYGQHSESLIDEVHFSFTKTNAQN
jgi:hypothetical protein